MEWTGNDTCITLIGIVLWNYGNLARPYITRLIARLLAWICYGYERWRNSKHAGDPQIPNEGTALLPNTSGLEQGSTELSPSRQRSSCSSLGNKICSRDTVARVTSALIFYVYVGATMVVLIHPADKTGQSGSKTCGVWGTFQNSQGCQNDVIWPMSGMLLSPIVLWSMGFETKKEFGEEKIRSGWFDNGRLIGLEWAIWRIANPRRSLTRSPDQRPEPSITASINTDNEKGGKECAVCYSYEAEAGAGD